MVSYFIHTQCLITRCCYALRFAITYSLLLLCICKRLSRKVICTSFNCLIMEIPVFREFTFEWASVKGDLLSLLLIFYSELQIIHPVCLGILIPLLPPHGG